VFEIGSSLRDARERQGLDLNEVERATHIRPRYLTALEEERFDVLPGPAYIKGFLRAYADFLGLDSDRFVDEYSSRFPPTEEAPAVPLARVRRRRAFIDSPLVIVAFAVLLGLIGWRLSSMEGGGHTAAVPPPVTHTRVSQPTPSPAPPPVRRPATARIVFTASGPCWLSVHVGAASGRLLYERTLEAGQSARFVARRLWIRLGAPWNLTARLNGKPVELPQFLGNVLVTPSGVSTE
jgi:transcriptional regulator with XRE-family HTH domain